MRSWGYQLQRARPEQIANDIDLLVVDYSSDGTEHRAYTREEVEAFRRRSSGPPRIVLSYMSIGEAEAYRYYWSPLWNVSAPRWLGHENAEWRRNYLVRFWDRDWQRVLFIERPTALHRLAELQFEWMRPYLDRIIDAGFDGVYLDRVDAWESWKDERPGAEADMIRLVTRLAEYARHRRPGFLIVPQNAEELLRHPEYRSTVDAIAKEDLLYGIGGDGVRNSEDDVTAAMTDLGLARSAGRPVFVVEYLADAERRFEANLKLRQSGFIPHFAARQLSAVPDTTAHPVPAQPSLSGAAR